MNRVIVIAPHPDDETLGCGGTLLKHQVQGDELYWLIVTAMRAQDGYSNAAIVQRNKEIQHVTQSYPFKEVFKLDFPAAHLDSLPLAKLVGAISDVFTKCQPNTVYLPFPGDVHSDHKCVFDAALACTKWFRYPAVKRILAYETLSETEFGLDPTTAAFRPNVFVDISSQLDQKIAIMNIYASELSKFPFPRSEEALRALAKLRGSTAGCAAAESFMLLKEVQ